MAVAKECPGSPPSKPLPPKSKLRTFLSKAPVPAIIASLLLLGLIASLAAGLTTRRHRSNQDWNALDDFCGLPEINMMVDDTSRGDVTNIPANTSLKMTIRAEQNQTSIPVRLITFNIRYATSRPVSGEEPWSVRMPKLTNQLNFTTTGHNNSFICLQETLHKQLLDVQSQLGDLWSHIGRGRGVKETDGEYSPIFYRSDYWKVERSTTRWLSKTPEKHSKGWDAVLERIATLAEFSHRETGTRVVVISTHFDHIGRVARQCSARLLIRWAEEWGRKDGVDASAVLIGGDFNSPPEDGAYKIMTASGSGMSDLADLVPESKHYGNKITYTSFGEPEETASRLDYLFLRDSKTTEVQTFGVLPNRFDDEVRLSDHRAVVSDLDIAI